MPKAKQINLLPQEEFESSTLGRILKWVMTTFRYIVILTEMIVMGAFLSRFWLDAQNADLSDSMKAKSAQIDSQASFEQNFRKLQSQLAIFKSLDSGDKTTSIFTKIAQKVPSEVLLQNVSIQDEKIQVKAIASNEVGVAQFVSNLKADKFFKKTTLGQTSSQETNQFLTVFSVDLTY